MALFPFMLFVALVILLESSGPVFFTQKRLGRDGRIFKVYKFRTMTNRVRTEHREITGHNTEVTRIGYWLRRFKIDELPQLLNIVRGDMSLVGPRPALPEQAKEYNPQTRRRLAVRPGLTGLAQINGNIYLSWPERWKYDVSYVEQCSFLLDLWIVWRTIWVIFIGEQNFLYRNAEREQL